MGAITSTVIVLIDKKLPIRLVVASRASLAGRLPRPNGSTMPEPSRRFPPPWSVEETAQPVRSQTACSLAAHAIS
jgi:hypothetical protein